MSLFLDYTLNGITQGMIFAALALALVLIYRSTHIINFAQGAMGMMTTFIAFSLLNDGLSYWWALAAVLGIGFVFGIVVERLLIRPLQGRSELNPVIVSIGLLIVLEGIAGAVYGNSSRGFPAAFSQSGLVVGHTHIAFSHFDVFILVAVLVLFSRDARALQRDRARPADARIGIGARDVPVARGARRSHAHPRLGARRDGGCVGGVAHRTNELV